MLRVILNSIRCGSLTFALGAGLLLSTSASHSLAADACAAGANAIVCENSKPGTPSSEWDIFGNGDLTIQGFATEMSVNVGGSIGFKVDTDASDYSLQIYRMGWYGGDGARLVDTLTPSVVLPQIQPECLTESTTYLMDCGNWTLSATWDVPSDAISGVYIARLRRTDTGGDSHVVFVVRDDSNTADILFQTSDTTWQAYNNYGDRSFYGGGPNGRAYKVSYNRPMFARGGTPDGRDSFFGSEYAMIRWLERNEYDVSYFSSIDTDRANPALLINHKVFLSVGHDEYWSGQQRANVEAARDAGVNLIFASGNEVYWKTRWESSIDNSNTDYRTLVSYKETASGAKIDPSPEWTGTWRDTRFSSSSDGGRPENELTGTLFTVNCCTYALRVPAEYGNLRFWRNTTVATLAPGTEAVFPFGTLGYEWDEDLDNGFRPPGVFRMSRTTETVAQRLIDFGQTVAVEEATHHLMMYRAASGALVFGAGTVQWSWGLDDYHDGLEAPVDADMQQATVNLLADMGVQPHSLESGLVAATASTDTIPPQVTITSPSSGIAVQHGEVVTITGTASDSGGVIAAVEVSLDEGVSWHPATGRESWSYSGSSLIRGPQTFLARASDDSGNLGATDSILADVSCPCTIFGEGPLPRVDSFASSTAIELGVKFQSDIDGYIAGIRYYKGPTNNGTHSASLWTTSGLRLATGTFVDESPSGWQELRFVKPVAISADTIYIASYFAPSGYTAQVDGFASQAILSPPLRALKDMSAEANGVYASSSTSTFPNQSFNSTNYWVDVVFSDVELPDTNAPTLVSNTPLDGTSSVSVDTVIALVVDETIDTGAMQLQVFDGNANVVPGTVSFDEATSTVTFLPTAALGYAETHTVSAIFTDIAGNTMLEPFVFTFVTSQPDGAVAALWNDSEVPAIIDANDANSIELGTRFTASRDLDITGVRFYKSVTNTGEHLGSLWDASGNLLAQVDFSNESVTGWQQASFSTPVRVTAGQIYVISYFAPNGRYSATGGYFGQSKVSGPLTAPSAAAGGNGVYAYGSGGFPAFSGNGTNYWVTPVYEIPPDEQSPLLVSTIPLGGATSVAANAVVSAIFNEPVDVSTISMNVTDGAGAAVAGSISYDNSLLMAQFVASAPLAPGSVHTVEVSVSDLIGNATSSPLVFSFKTSLPDGAVAALWNDSAVPAIIDSGETSSLELGTKFIADRDLDITGVRFYKSVANSGPHSGSLWNTSGTLLARIAFDSESSTGWQQATFSTPVLIDAGQTYVVSYSAPNGHYSVSGDYFNLAQTNGPLTAPASDSSGGNGVYVYGAGNFPSFSYNRSNYWVTPVYEIPADILPPVLVSTTPVAGETSVGRTVVISADFDEPVDVASLGIIVSDTAGTFVDGSVAYNEALQSVVFSPFAQLAAAMTYVVEISATDLIGNATSSPLVFSFKTSLPNGAVAALWEDSAVPAIIDSGETSSIELGTKFTADRDLVITGVRFYKAANNTGTHVGSLWDNTGVLLAQAIFDNESGAGWQEVTFAESVIIQQDVQHVVSYLAPDGHYSATSGYFGTARTSGSLTAPASASAGGNGVYAYGNGGFPTASSNQTNYWVTPVYEQIPDIVAPTLVAVTPLNDSSSVALDTEISAQFDGPVDAGSVAMLALDETGEMVSGSVSYDDVSMTISFTPSAPLAPDTVYMVEISATDLSGNFTTSPLLFSFRTIQANGTVAALWDDSVAPVTIDSGDTNSIEVGTKFTTEQDVEITGVRFYKSPNNTGTHVGSLWDSSGALLSQVTFSGESSTGWQQALFTVPVLINPGQTYVVSYHAPNGRYSATGGYFNQAQTAGPLTAPASSSVGGNGVYAYGNGSYPTFSTNQTNYWVTAIYQEIQQVQEQIPPALVGTTPVAGASSVALQTEVSVIFDEPVEPSSISMSVTGSGGIVVTGSLTYEASTQTATFLPSSPLETDTVYIVQISASDILGNATVSPLEFSFRTSRPDGQVTALWDDSVIPGGIDSGDSNLIQVGTKFIADQTLDITGIRFYKSIANTGTHVGSLWNASGTLLAQVTFSSESTTGWQQADFPEPIRIGVGQRYVVSYLAPEGRYSATGGYFNQAYSNGPLTALASSAAGGNGVYSYETSSMPTSSYNNSNYWVSPVYTLLPPPDNTGEGLWNTEVEPDTIDAGDTNSIEVGMRFQADEDLDIVGLRFYKSAANLGAHVGSLWDVTGTLLAQVTFDYESSTGWQVAQFIEPIRITAGEVYLVSYYAPVGHYSSSGGYFEQAYSSGPLTAPASIPGSGNGVYAYGSGGFPSSSYNKTNYWITPIYEFP